MKIVPLASLDYNEYHKVHQRMKLGRMTRHIVDGRLCYDADELENFKKRCAGRKPKI